MNRIAEYMGPDKRRPLLRGAGSVFSLYSPVRFRHSPSDYYAILSDWRIVGVDIEAALNEVCLDEEGKQVGEEEGRAQKGASCSSR